MTRRSYTRTISTNAPPSRSGWTEGQPRECCRCNRQLRITKDVVVSRRFPKVETFCLACWKATADV